MTTVSQSWILDRSEDAHVWEEQSKPFQCFQQKWWFDGNLTNKDWDLNSKNGDLMVISLNEANYSCHWVALTQNIENPILYVVCCVDTSNTWLLCTVDILLNSFWEQCYLDLVLCNRCGKIRWKSDQNPSLIGYNRRLMAVMRGCMVLSSWYYLENSIYFFDDR